MNIVLDTTSIRSRSSGIGIYIKNLLEGMIDVLETDDRFPYTVKTLYRNKAFFRLLQIQSNGFYYPFPSELSLQILRRSNLAIKIFETVLGKPHIFHGLDYLNYPLSHSFNLLTIHDLSFIRYPQYAPDRVLNIYQKRLETCLQWTHLIITVSENSKADIMEFFNISSQKIWVTPLASRYHPSFALSNGVDQRCQSFPFPYLLFVSTLEPRKNIGTLIQVFEILKQRYHIPHHLILIGKKGWKYTAILDAIESSPVQSDIHQLDYIDDRLLFQFYQGARVFLYPSHYEGFGLPVLEAMSFGVPVITSNQASLPEVTGDAALLVHPQDIEGLVEATRSLIEDPNLWQHFSQAGRKRSLLFSWKATALKTLQAYQSLG